MNSVELELVKLKHTWQREVRQQPKASTYVFLGQKHETQIFETLFKKQISDQSDTSDVYMIHYQTFDNKQTYGAFLVSEWLEVFEQWKAYEPVEVDWQPITQFNSQNQTDAYRVAQAFSSLIQLFPFLKENKIFLHLAPFQISSASDYQEWLLDCGKELEKLGLNTQVKLVISDHINYRVIPKTYKSHSFSMPININQLMSNTLEGTSTLKDNKKHNFQHFILKASSYLSQQNFQPAEGALDRALALSVAERNDEQIVISYSMKAQTYFAQMKFEQAHECYQLALKNSQGNDQLEAQMRFHLASFYLSQQKKESAIEQLEHIISLATNLDDQGMLIQAYRLLAQIEETTKNFNKAVDYYEQAFNICLSFPKEQQLEQNLHYIAHCLISCPQSEGIRNKVELFMVKEFGKNWRDSIILPNEDMISENQSIKL